MATDVDIAKRLDWIEQEIHSLKSMIKAKNAKEKKVVKLKGICKGIVIDDSDIEEAKSSLFGG